MTVFANIFEMLAENQTTVSANTFGDAEGNDKAKIETGSSPVISQIIPAKTWQTAVSHYTKATWNASDASNNLTSKYLNARLEIMYVSL